MIATTRRRWSRQQKLAILAEVDAAGGSVSEVARRHSMHTSLLFRWRRDLGAPISEPAISAPSAAPSFVPVLLPSPSSRTASAPVQTKIETSHGDTTGAIEITIAGGRTVRVHNDVDTIALVRVIDALERHAEGVRERVR